MTKTSSDNKEKRVGRPRNENYLPWEDARDFMRAEMIPSRGKFFEWHDRHKPKAIPRYPYRVYKDWTSWNDFLGTNNKFNEKIGTNWLKLEEAAKFVHTLKLESQAEWLEYCRSNEMPKEIPIRPDLVYDGWKSWNHWLGKTAADIIDVQQEVLKQAIFFIVLEPDFPGNVLTFGVEQAGPTALKERVERHHLKIVRLFWYEEDKGPVIHQIVNSLSTEYLGDERTRIVPNVWEIIWHLSTHLQMITSF